MFREFCKIVKESLQDNATGRYSHSRIIAMLVALAATIFIWKLIILGGMGIEYFIAYLAYGTGHQSLNKFLDNRDTSRVVEAQTKKIETQRAADKENFEQVNDTSVTTVTTKISKPSEVVVSSELYTDDDIPRPPRG